MEKYYEHDPHLVVKPAFYSNGIPVFKPTMEQFQDFYKFNKAVNQYGMKSGIIKIIPPIEWQSQIREVYTSDNLENVVIRNPIVQNVNSTAGFKGVYSSQNIERQRKYSLSQWLELSKKPNFQPPAPKKRRASAASGSQETKTLSTRAKEHHRSKRPNKDSLKETLDMKLNIDVSEFTEERCDELEHLYWRSLGYAEPMYGADVLGSLFQDSIKSWNVAHLPNLLDLMDEKVPGVNDAYLYAGLWKATFSWHLEDQDLYSINYLHFGAPKQWYSISQKDSARFYDLMKDIFNEDYKNCSEFLRHKTFLASPAFLKKNGINCNKIVHNQGEFIITYPYGYHAGFNYGYNLAESVNFALDEWFEFAAKTKKCECVQDSVGINSRQIFCKFKGIPYDELDLPTKKESPSHPKTAERKPLKKRRNTRSYGQCMLCPIDLPQKLLEFREFELLNCDATDPKSGNSLQVHRICSEAFPQYLHLEAQGESTCVIGMKDIPRSYRSLKCLHCRLPNKYSATDVSHGACFQCSVGSCSKSYHPICALSQGFLFNNQTCKVHRRSSSKFYERNNEEYLKLASLVKENSLIQFSENASERRHTGDIRCGLVQRNNHEERTFDVLVFPSLEQSMKVLYDDILLGDSSDIDNKRFWNMDASTARLPAKRSNVLEVQDEQKINSKRNAPARPAPRKKSTSTRKQTTTENTNVEIIKNDNTKNRNIKTHIDTDNFNIQIDTEIFNTQIDTEIFNTQTNTNNFSTPLSCDNFKSNTFNPQINTNNFDSQIDTDNFNPQITIDNFNPEININNPYTQINSNNFNPQINSNNFSPQINSNNLPQINSNKIVPHINSNNFNPQVNSNNLNPQINANNLNPQINSNNLNPQINSNNLNPQINSNNLNPQINSNNLNTQIISNNLNTQTISNNLISNNLNTENIRSNMTNEAVSQLQQIPSVSAPGQLNTWNALEYNAVQPRYTNQFLPAMPLMSACDGYNYTFQHPRGFSDSSSWLLPVNRPARAVFINEYSERNIQSNPQVNQIQFVPENFY